MATQSRNGGEQCQHRAATVILDGENPFMVLVVLITSNKTLEARGIFDNAGYCGSKVCQWINRQQQ
jgi:hypothetical protein